MAAMTENEFTQLWNERSTEVADQFYPKGRSGSRRGEFLRDQGVLLVKILGDLQESGLVEPDGR
jgi:hypothetical protein